MVRFLYQCHHRTNGKKCIERGKFPYIFTLMFNLVFACSFTTRRDKWVTCNDTGYFIHGFVTTGSNYLYQMGKFQCCKPISHPNRDVGCTDVDVDFTQDGNKTCPGSRFLKGVHTANDNQPKGGIRFLDKIRCCAMVPGKQNIL